MAGRRVPMKCTFCEEYKQAYELKKEYEEKYGYKVHLQARLYVRGMKVDVTKFEDNKLPRMLKYCPSCGKKFAK